jgi:hypothetical protein
VSMSMSLLFLDVVAQAEDLNARVKGTATCAPKHRYLPSHLRESQVKVLHSTTRHQLCPTRVWTGL